MNKGKNKPPTDDMKSERKGTVSTMRVYRAVLDSSDFVVAIIAESEEKAEQIATRHKATIILDAINGGDRSYEIVNADALTAGNVNDEEKLLAMMAAAIFGANTNTEQNISVAVGAARGILAYIRDKKASKAAHS